MHTALQQVYAALIHPHYQRSDTAFLLPLWYRFTIHNMYYIWLDITTLLHHAEHAQDSMKPLGSLVPYIRSSRDNRRPHIGRRVSAKPYNALVCFHCSWRLFHLTANTTSRRTLHTFHFLQWVGASPVLAMAGSSNATLVAELLT